MALLQRIRKRSTLLVALFFLALAAIGLCTSGDYGQPWDEPWEQDILRMNGNQYALELGLEARFALRSNITTAPPSGLIAQSAERDHGECAYYPMLWLVADNGLSEAARMTLWHGYTWLLFLAGVAALWLICRRLGLSRLLSSAAALLLVLSPRMFAEGHYNNKDIVLLTLTLGTLWLALRLMEKPSAARGALFSLAGAMAANTKVIGMLVWGLCALTVLLRQLAGRRMTAAVWRAASVTVISFAGFYALLTPALWSDPPGYLRYVFENAVGFTRWDHSVLFRGAIFDLSVDVLPRYYLPYLLLVTTPLWILPLIAAGQLFALGRLGKLRWALLNDEQALLLAVCTLLWLFPLLVAVLGHPILYNGWRHFYFLYGPMLVLAAYGLRRMGEALGRLTSKIWRRAGAGALALCLALSGAGLVSAHPYQYVYYNVLTVGQDLPEYLELDYWNVSVLGTLHSLLAQTPGEETISIAGAELWSQQGLESAWQLLTPEEQARLRVLPQDATDATYQLSNRTYAVLGRWTPPADAVLVAETAAYGWPLCAIYRLAAR